MPSTPFPSWLKKGRVRGKQLVVDVDTDADVDTDPDATYPQGTLLTFTPSVDTLVFPTDQTSVYPQQVIAQVNASGDPITPDGDALYLVANIGQSDNDQTWFWTCQPVLVYNGRSTKLTRFRFDVTANVDNYLTDQQPIPASSAGSSVVRGAAGASIVDVDVDPDTGAVTLTMSDASTVESPSLAAFLAGNYVPRSEADTFVQIGVVAVDTDGVCYPISGVGMVQDTDGTYYYAPPPASLAKLTVDTDSVLYPVAI